MQLFAAVLAAVVVGTWNGNWFPSGDPDHRPPADIEALTVQDAGRLLARGLAEVDPLATNDVILCLNEIRDPASARALADAVGRTNLTLAIISAYRWKDNKFDRQQDAILTTLPVAASSWSRWRKEKDVWPPRGYAHAELVLSPAVTASVYAVHLKANIGYRETKTAAENRAKRGAAVRQLVAIEKPRRGATPRPVLIAGDFNADPARAEFKADALFSDLAGAGFEDLLLLLPRAARATHPNKKYGGSALDHIFVRGLDPVGTPRIIPAHGLSDHNPVFALVSFRYAANASKRRSPR